MYIPFYIVAALCLLSTIDDESLRFYRGSCMVVEPETVMEMQVILFLHFPFAFEDEKKVVYSVW
jgi:hypothetical protein